jgi:ribosomal protein S18 acetylase RimI-like enzyme
MASHDSAVTISPVRTPDDLSSAVALFHEYTERLAIDLTFQDYATEMASMPGKYSPPKGDLLLAKLPATNIPIGCVALRPLPNAGDHVCEMKRLYVAPAGRGSGAGRALALAVISLAEQLGYREMRLDTLSTMAAALKLYHGLGFVSIPAYYSTPIEGTSFLSLALPRAIT